MLAIRLGYHFSVQQFTTGVKSCAFGNVFSLFLQKSVEIYENQSGEISFRCLLQEPGSELIILLGLWHSAALPLLLLQCE